MKTTINCLNAILRQEADKIYKDVKVFFWSSQNGMSWRGSIYINKNASIETLQHEYGHTLQYKILGFWGYVFKVAIPSLVGIWEYNHSNKTIDDYVVYHKIPSEAEADKLGGNQFWENGILHDALAEKEIQEILNEKIKEK